MALTPSKDGKITIANVLFPVSLIAFILFILLAFQSMQIMRERDSLHEAKASQTKTLEEAQKVQAQLDALAIGTKKLATKGDKNAKIIVDRMKQLGITIGSPQPGAAAPAASPAPAAAPAKPAPAAPAEEP